MIGRGFRRTIPVLVGGVIGFGWFACVAPAATVVSCGDTVTTSITVANDLNGCTGSAALTIAAPDIVVNLNLHQITGAGSSTGVVIAPSASNAVLLNGDIRGFAIGLDVEAAAAQATSLGLFNNGTGINVGSVANVELTQNWLNQNAVGIEIAGRNPLRAATGTLVKQNTIGRGNVGIDAVFGMQSQIVDNTVFQNTQSGISIFESGESLIDHNYVSDNDGRGIAIFDSDAAQVTKNRSLRNGGDGLFVKDSFVDVIGNTVNDNAGNGITYSENSADRAFQTRLGSNTVLRNAGIGVLVPVLTTDLGGNVVRRNRGGDWITY